MHEELPAGLHEVSAQLTRARAQARALPGPPSMLPETLEHAYRVQANSIRAWDDTVAGWKVGGVPPAYLDRFDDKRLAGPIFARSVQRVPTDGAAADMPVFEGGFAAIEPEFIFQLGATRDEDRLFIGAEIASSPIPDINDYGPVAVICDFGNNHGLLIGAEVENWRDLSGPVTVRCMIDGKTIGEKRLEQPTADAEAALAFLLEAAGRRNLDVIPGTFVSSGAITGVHEAEIGAHSHIDFGDLGSFDLRLTKALPRP
ncbi:hypothetical protein D6201_11590 [Aurantiacibacter aquimixticola]|uniref:2-keto-4-pentenoate hydratase n=2 Tax=Aurantiacibacter aquimixticola TaxID=1958945 RepID=A0A419RVV7_9SPHN|nr:hypothetical protein D6201_11590 [Aurantiacibacter aquimixticola]